MTDNSEGSEPIKLTELDFFKIPKLEYSYGDKKELPSCLLREIHEAMFYWCRHMHPNQKYKTDDFDLSKRATEIALKYIESLQQQLKEERNKAIDECIQKTRDLSGYFPSPALNDILKSHLESLKADSK